MRYIVVPVRPLPPGQLSNRHVSAGAEPAQPAGSAADNALACWVETARLSLDACLVVDSGGKVAALSDMAAELLGTTAASLVGRSLDQVLNLVDLSDGAHEARGAARRIPPLIAVAENALSRGMMRIRLPDGERRMLDAVAAPIHDDEHRPVGAVSFLASV